MLNLTEKSADCTNDLLAAACAAKLKIAFISDIE